MGLLGELCGRRYGRIGQKGGGGHTLVRLLLLLELQLEGLHVVCESVGLVEGLAEG